VVGLFVRLEVELKLVVEIVEEAFDGIVAFLISFFLPDRVV